MRVICNRPCLTGDYGLVELGQEFEVSDETGKALLSRDLVRLATPPRIVYERKVLTPEAPMVSPRPSFRDVYAFDQQPPRVVAESNSLFSAADVPIASAGPPDRVRRTRRARPTAG